MLKSKDPGWNLEERQKEIYESRKVPEKSTHNYLFDSYGNLNVSTRKPEGSKFALKKGT